MHTVNIEIQEDLVAFYGLEAIKKLLEDELDYQLLRLLKDRIRNGMSNSGVDWEKEFEQGRAEAFKEYKKRRAANSARNLTST